MRLRSSNPLVGGALGRKLAQLSLVWLSLAWLSTGGACTPARGDSQPEPAKSEVSPGSASAAASDRPAPATAPSASARNAQAAPSASAENAGSAADAGAAPFLELERDGGKVPAANAKRILHVGDSMVPLVGNYLRPVVQKQGGKYFIESVTSSSTLSWDNDRLLQQAMFKYNPELILISLGSNELFDRTPERRAPAIQRLVADTRGRPCLWIGPPAWKKDYGFIEVLKQNLGHCRYLDSIALKMPRMADGRHPSWGGSYRWATTVWKLLGGTEPVPTGDVSPK